MNKLSKNVKITKISTEYSIGIGCGIGWVPTKLTMLQNENGEDMEYATIDCFIIGVISILIMRTYKK